MLVLSNSLYDSHTKRTNLVLDEALLKEAVRVLGTRTYSGAVNLALKEVLLLKRIQGLADQFGTAEWQGNLSEMRKDSQLRKLGDSQAILVDTSVWI